MGAIFLIVMVAGVPVLSRQPNAAKACEAVHTTYSGQEAYLYRVAKQQDGTFGFVQVQCGDPVIIPQRQVVEPSRTEYPFQDAVK